MGASDFFRGKHVLITGGSSGIGYATAKRLLEHGASVTILARRESVLAEAKGKLGGGDRVRTLPLDVADEAQVVEKVGAHVAAHPADVLLNNAGVVMPGRFVELESRHFREMMDINYFGAVNMCRAVVPHLVARGGGNICNVSSVAGAIGIYGYTAYAASKFAVRGFSEALRGEMWPHRIGVHVCLPPDTDTPQLAFENQYKPKETKAIAGQVKTMSAEAVADAMLEGVAAGEFEIVPGLDAKFSVIGARVAPGLARWVCDSAQRKA
ncbi:MAG: SDR family oxidoreductase [Myxococcota bacterium]